MQYPVVVDDNPSARQVLMEMLLAAGLRTAAAGGGDEANFYALYLPGMGLLDADQPNNVASLVVQLQMAF